MQLSPIVFLIKVSLTIIILISFLYIGTNYCFDRMKFSGLWTIGLGLFSVNYILLTISFYGYESKALHFLQMAAYMYGSFFIVYGSIKLLDVEHKNTMKIAAVIGAIILVLYGTGIGNVKVIFLGYFSMLCYINSFAAFTFFKAHKSPVYSRKLIAAIFIAMAVVDISNYVSFIFNNVFLLDLYAKAIILIIAYQYSTYIYIRSKTNLAYEKEVCFEETFNNSSMGMCLVDTNGRIIHTNSAFRKMLGYTESELLSKTYVDITYSDDAKNKSIRECNKIDTIRRSFQLEKRYVHKNGNIVWVILTVSIIRDKQGNNLYYIAQAQDITDYKTVYNKLAISNEKYETLLDCYDSAIVVLDKEFKYVVANQYYVNKINEYTKEKYTTTSILGQSLEEVYKGKIENERFKAYRYAMKTRKQIETTLYYKTPKGESRWYEFNISPYEEGILIIIKDVTDKVKNQKNLEEKEAKYRSLVEQSLDGIVLANKDGYIIEFNREMERISGISKEEAVNMHIVDMHVKLSKGKAYRGMDVEGVKKGFEKEHIDSKTPNKSRTYYAEITNKDGNIVNVEEFYYPIITESAKMVCFTFRDITELKKLEKIKEKVEENERLTKETIELDRLRSEFFANLSHEFRTPLNIILSANKMIQNLMDNYPVEMDYMEEHQKVRKYLNSSKQNCYRLLRLINNIIDITKMDAGFFHSNLKCWNIVSVVEEITQSIADYARNKGIYIIFDTDVEEKNTICDADAIERIILNLLSNAIKFTGEGGNINVALKDMNEYIEISVEDSGIGIPEEQLPLIFNRFKQVDKSLARRHEGSGIGLSLVKSLVEMHGGTIDVFSKIGEGTRFIVKLPTKTYCYIDEVAAAKELYDSKVEKVNNEFSDIYF